MSSSFLYKNEVDGYEIIKCSVCLGGERDAKCQKCLGFRFGLWLGGRYWYLGNSLSKEERASIKMKKRIEKAFDVLVFILIVLISVFVVVRVYFFFGSDFLENFFYNDVRSFGLIGLLFCYSLFRYEIKRERDLFVYQSKSKYSTDKSDYENFDRPKKHDLFNSFDAFAQDALYDAWELAFILGHEFVRPIHLLAVLPYFSRIASLFARLGITSTVLREHLTTSLSRLPHNDRTRPQLSDSLYQVVLFAYIAGYQARVKKVSVVDILSALMEGDYQKEEKKNISDIFEQLEITTDTTMNVLEWLRVQRSLYDRYKRFHSLARFKPKGDVNRSMTAIATKTLDLFSEDLTRLAAYENLSPLMGRHKEIQEIFRTIEGSGKSILLVGNMGIGKGAIIEGIAQLMVTEDVPLILQDKRLVDVSLERLIGGVDPAGAADRLLRILGEAIFSGNIVLSIKNIERMTGITTGDGGVSLDLLQIMMNALKRKGLFAIATTDPNTYSRYLEGAGIMQAFNVIKIEELNENQTIQVLESKVAFLEGGHSVYFSYESLEKSVVLTNRYIHERYQPAKAIDILEEVAVYVQSKEDGDRVVRGEDVAIIVSNRTGIPLTSLTRDERDKLLQMESLIHARIVGQEEAVSVVASSLRRARMELRDGKRPIASLLFLGPTGVGKTEVSKTLADIYFGSESSMLRFDMSEYQDISSLDRLLGTLTMPGHLVETVRRQPFALLLFDEIEKAHRDVLNIFLQIMDDGRLTDGMGRTVDFTNTIIIATSNAGTEFIQDELIKGTDMESVKDALLRDQLKKYYRPELLNRFDSIVVFKPLTFDDIMKIARILLAQVAKRLEQKSIEFKYTDSFLEELSRSGYDPSYGARPLRRVIQNTVDNKLADYLLTGELKKHYSICFDANGVVDIKKKNNV